MTKQTFLCLAAMPSVVESNAPKLPSRRKGCLGYIDHEYKEDQFTFESDLGKERTVLRYTPGVFSTFNCNCIAVSLGHLNRGLPRQDSQGRCVRAHTGEPVQYATESRYRPRVANQDILMAICITMYNVCTRRPANTHTPWQLSFCCPTST